MILTSSVSVSSFSSFLSGAQSELSLDTSDESDESEIESLVGLVYFLAEETLKCPLTNSTPLAPSWDDRRGRMMDLQNHRGKQWREPLIQNFLRDWSFGDLEQERWLDQCITVENRKCLPMNILFTLKPALAPSPESASLYSMPVGCLSSTILYFLYSFFRST